jgi:hypothetical protein
MSDGLLPSGMAHRRTVLPLAAALAILALTACSTPAPSASPTSPSATTPSDTSTPTASAGVTDAPAALVVSTDGIGSLKLGKPVPAGDPLVTWTPNVCGEGGLWTPAADAGFSISTADLAEKGAVNGVQVNHPDIRTPSGLHVGSTKAEVAAALPGAKYQVASVYGTADVGWYSVEAGGNRITLSITSADGAKVGDSTKVAFIFVLPASRTDTHYIGTGGVGSCA